jgi:hypothetical protein
VRGSLAPEPIFDKAKNLGSKANETMPQKKDLQTAGLFFVEGPVGFEPTTRGLKGHCSNLLSYGPAIAVHK